MAKSPKNTPTSEVSPPLPEELDLLERSKVSVEQGLDVLHAVMDRVKAMLTDPNIQYDDRLASHYAWLLSHQVKALDAARKIDAHYHRYAKTASAEERDALVVKYLRDLPKARRAAIRSLLEELDGEDRALLS